MATPSATGRSRMRALASMMHAPPRCAAANASMKRVGVPPSPRFTVVSRSDRSAPPSMMRSPPSTRWLIAQASSAASKRSQSSQARSPRSRVEPRASAARIRCRLERLFDPGTRIAAARIAWLVNAIGSIANGSGSAADALNRFPAERPPPHPQPESRTGDCRPRNPRGWRAWG